MTYNATLAELTSLEEMMRHLMEEGSIHEDIVTKLWQVYSMSILPSSYCHLTRLQVLTEPFLGRSGEEPSSSLACSRSRRGRLSLTVSTPW